MLVLSRKSQQQIFIGDDIKIIIVECNKGKTRIGIEAPKSVRIVRSEIKDKPHES